MMGVFGFLPYALTGMSTRWVIALFVAMFGLCALVIAGANNDGNRARQNYTRALNKWLAECGKPVEACAYDWDNSYTLRDIYYQRSQAKSGVIE